MPVGDETEATDRRRPVADEDQRGATRFRVPDESYAAYPGGKGQIGDLSMGGVFVRDPDPLPLGSSFDCELHVGSEVVRIRGVVRHRVARTGMGVEFEPLSPANKGLLRRLLHTVARGPAEDPRRRKKAARRKPEPAELPAPALSAEEATARLLRISAELRSLEASLLAANSDHRVLREFRDAVDQVRLTAWSVHHWQELESENRDPYAVLPQLVNERIRRARQLTDDVTQDLDAEEFLENVTGLKELAAAVERLHERLAPLIKSLRKK